MSDIPSGTAGHPEGVPLIVDHVARVVARLLPADRSLDHLDIGAGWGHLIERLRRSFPGLRSSAVDYNPRHFQIPDVRIEHVDLNVDRLPFNDASFDLVTCTEVVEHVENYRHSLREAARVLRPGGWIVDSTPNVLSLKSRWAYLTRGFFTYFDPLPLKDDTRIYPGGRHITPIPFFYLAHGLADAGFIEITPNLDKEQKSSRFWSFLIGPMISAVAARAHRRRIRHFGAHPEMIENLARANNARAVMTGRTLIVTARRV